MGHQRELAFIVLNGLGPGRGPRAGNNPSVRIEMRVLLLATTGDEPSFRAWKVALNREGVPFEAVVLGRGRTRRPSSRFGHLLTAGVGRSRFQALILATGDVFDQAMSRGEREDLDALARDFGLRRLIAYVYPSAEYGLRGPARAGPLHGVNAELSPSGRRIFPYLCGTVPIEAGSWGYLAPPLSAESFETLMVGPEGSALLGIRRHRDGREDMVQTYDSNPDQVQTQLLRHGQLAWLTRGSYLGCERNYLSLQIDDILLANHSWNVATHQTDRHPPGLIRMSATDAMHAASWSRARGMRLDLACNGGGSESYLLEHGSQVDPLLRALQAERETFGWINHTYDHVNLDEASRTEIETQIERNLHWAHSKGLELEPGTLVTGEHSGLANLAVTPPRGGNPQLDAALQSRGIRHLACDASRPYPMHAQDPEGPRWPPGAPFAVGPALAVPRHPTAVPYDASTAAQALDRHRHEAAGIAPVSWKQVLLAEATRMFAVLMGNDPRPHYFHQSNLAGADKDGGIFYGLIDTLLNLYRSLFAPNAPLVQPTLAETGWLLAREGAWRAALAADSVGGYVEGPTVTVVNRTPASLEVPLSGTEVGADYGGTRSGWIRVQPGETVVSRDWR
jgi:hypothetical protein